MQARVIDLLSQVSLDDITVDLLRYNDEFNNAFKTFENYMQERNKRFGSTQMPISNQMITSPIRTSNSISKSPINKTSSSPHDADNAPALITFDDEPTNSFQNMRIYPTPSGVVPRNIQPQPRPAATTQSATNYQDPERDVREVEQWLKIQGDESDNDESSHQESGTTDAFNNFLQKRASTIPNEPISDQQIRVNLQDPPKHNQKSNTYL
ncbi:unnamed protein product [Rotaria sp. Silwood2]|nr:unnamed protein product [Rotaria sp. Silwood2]CAF4578034.1 unnamed protein product [Rotaria sp. Silwood2]